MISNEPLSITLYCRSLKIVCPSFVHVMDGVGTPLASQRITILVLVSAVTLSPMFTVMGFRSLASTDFGSPRILICGLIGSVK